ncbi:MAG: hypothetical protein M3478_10945 [Planctomycetota bacterium]|nr:hypothetical protein [Planctomycetota bacterium]
MRTLQVTLTDDERRDAETRARELGFSSVEAYARSLIASDVELPVSAELEAELLQAMSTPARQMTPADWDEERRRLIERQRQAKAG